MSYISWRIQLIVVLWHNMVPIVIGRQLLFNNDQNPFMLHCEMASANWRLFCSGLNVLTKNQRYYVN